MAAAEDSSISPEPWVTVLRIFEREWSAVHGSELGLHSGQRQRASSVATWAREHVGPSGDWQAAVALAAATAAREVKSDAKSPWAVFSSQPGRFATKATQAKREADDELRKVRESMLLEERTEALRAKRFKRADEIDLKLAEVRRGAA